MLEHSEYVAYGQEIQIQDLTIDFLRSKQKQKAMFTIMPNDIMVNGQWIDMQSVNLLVLVHDSLSEEKRKKFCQMIKTPVGFCRIAEKMWSLVE